MIGHCSESRAFARSSASTCPLVRSPSPSASSSSPGCRSGSAIGATDPGALTYTDKRLVGYDAAVLCEVIEHLDEPRLPALEYAILGSARPATVVVTTPNVEYNIR